MTASPRVAVIGGGLGGLAIARQLNLKSPARALDVEVLEASARVGGVIQTSHGDGFVREHAANGALGRPRGGLAELAADLGVSMIGARAAAKRRWIYASGGLREVPGSPLGLARSDLLSARAKLRLLAEPVVAPLAGEPTVAAFFRHRLGDEVHDRVVAPFVNGIYAGDTDELSMAASFPRVWSLAGRGGLFRGLIGQQFGARRRGETSGGRETSAPAAGMGEILSRLAEKLDGRIRLESPVASVAASPRGVDVIMESGKLEHFDAVVCAMPAYAASSVLADADRELGELLATIPFAPVAVVHLGYRRADIGHPLGGFGFLVAPSESLGVLGIVFESEIWDGRAPDGCALLRVMIGGRRSPGALSSGDDDLVAAARVAAEEVLEIGGQPVHQNLVRWPRAIAQYTVGHRERIERAENLAADQGVVLAGASYHGVAVNSVAQDAVRAARRVHELLAAPLALLLCLGLATAGCSGGASTTKTPGGDGGAPTVTAPPASGDAAVVEPTTAGAFRSDYRVLEVTTAGSIAVSVVAVAPAALVSSPGRTACGARSPSVVVHTLGGVAGAVVSVEGVPAGRDAVVGKRQRIALSNCRMEPRTLAVGRLDATLVVLGLDERRTSLDVKGGSVATALPMVPVGRAYDVAIAARGVYRLSGAGIEAGHVVVADTPYVGVTNERGELRIDDVPAGSYKLRVWHPPVVGDAIAAAIELEADVTVEAGGTAKATIDLSAALRAASP